MTFQATDYVVSSMPRFGENGEAIDALDLLVMLILSDCYDHEYPSPFPELSWLSGTTRLPEDTLIGVLRGLEAKGVLSVLRKRRAADPYSGHDWAFPGMSAQEATA